MFKHFSNAHTKLINDLKAKNKQQLYYIAVYMHD